MDISSPITRLLGLLLTPLIGAISLCSLASTRWSKLAILAYLGIYILAILWLHLVTSIVSEPYLDEIFHIPQAQAYCAARYDVWDPKLTTPPGLYIFATLFTKLRFGVCDVLGLRLSNALILSIMLLHCTSCRHIISNLWKSSLSTKPTSETIQKIPISAETIHTALNIALFPPLFFFSGLFYTDLLSTCIVLQTYWMFLQRKGAYENSMKGLLPVYLNGIAALFMRQTNVFWVAVFMGGLESVRIVKNNAVKDGEQTTRRTWKGKAISELKRYSRGEIHDILLKDAGVHDFILCAISIAVAIVYHPILIITGLWPYIALLISFASFVFWNGGVVLGDKANHVATIHLPQLLYLMAFTAFFAAPLIIPPTFAFLCSTLSLLRLPLFPRLVWKYALVGAYSAAALIATLGIIKYNTIIHPFTLADNRHYVFYIFRYSILRHPLIRYILAPIYLISGYLIYLTLCSPSTPPSTRFRPLPVEKKQPPTSKQAPRKVETIETQAERPRFIETSSGPTTSFLLILLLTTSLCLVTAPLVEPRYFIIPWIIWRLHVPSLLPASPTPRTKSKPKFQKKKPGRAARLLAILHPPNPQDHDPRLYFETLWFLAINGITGYVFLYRGFVWPQEGGKVQRFMW